MDKLDAYFNPKKNVQLDFEVFQFRQAKQQDETIDQFVTRLRKLAVICEFTELDKELKSAVIQHCTSKPLRRYALREEGLTLDKLMSKARALEASEQQEKGMEETSDKNTKNQCFTIYQKLNSRSKKATASSTKTTTTATEKAWSASHQGTMSSYW